MYVLLPLVLGLWCYIGWKIYDGLHDSDNTNFNVPVAAVFSDSVPVPESYTLQANYRDPFLGDLVRTAPAAVSGANGAVKQNVQKTSIPPSSPANWPAITYGGVIQKKQGQPLALLQVNGQDFLLRAGEKALDVTVVAIHRDSIVVGWNKQKRSFRK